MNLYNFNGKSQTLIVHDQINNLTINGSKNRIIVKARVSNMIVNGSKNDINVSNKKDLCYLVRRQKQSSPKYDH